MDAVRIGYSALDLTSGRILPSPSKRQSPNTPTDHIPKTKNSVCNDKNWFEPDLFTFQSNITDIDDESIPIGAVQGIGTVNLPVVQTLNSTEGKNILNRLNIANVLFVPSAEANILCARQGMGNLTITPAWGSESHLFSGVLKTAGSPDIVALLEPRPSVVYLERIMLAPESAMGGGPHLAKSRLYPATTPAQLMVRWPDSERKRIEALKQSRMTPKKAVLPIGPPRNQNILSADMAPLNVKEKAYIRKRYNCDEFQLMKRYGFDPKKEESRQRARCAFRVRMGNMVDDPPPAVITKSQNKNSFFEDKLNHKPQPKVKRKVLDVELERRREAQRQVIRARQDELLAASDETLARHDTIDDKNKVDREVTSLSGGRPTAMELFYPQEAESRKDNTAATEHSKSPLPSEDTDMTSTAADDMGSLSDADELAYIWAATPFAEVTCRPLYNPNEEDDDQEKFRQDYFFSSLQRDWKD